MEKIWRVNIEFEESLVKLSKEINEFDNLFLWLESDSEMLSTKRKFSEKFLNYIKECRNGVVPKITDKMANSQWWGDSSNLELARLVNSKLTSTEFALENDLCPLDTEIVSSIEEVEDYIEMFEDEEILIKKPFSYSGKGHIIFNSKDFDDVYDKIEALLETESLIIEQNLRRVSDFGTTFDDKKVFTVKNIVSKDGTYIGSVNSNFEQANYLQEKLLIVKKHYENLGWNGPVQIDSFYYLDKKEMHCYECVEVNCRKTMGLMSHELSLQFSKKDQCSMFILFPNKLKKRAVDFNTLKKYSDDKNVELYILNELDGYFSQLFIVSNSLDNLKEELDDLWEFFSNSPESLAFKF